MIDNMFVKCVFISGYLSMIHYFTKALTKELFSCDQISQCKLVCITSVIHLAVFYTRTLTFLFYWNKAQLLVITGNDSFHMNYQ